MTDGHLTVGQVIEKLQKVKERRIFDLANKAVDSIDDHYFANSPSYDLAMRVRRKLREIIDMVNPDGEN